MTAESLGWGPPGCTAQQLTRLTVPGLVDTPPYFPVRVRREVAPLFAELIRWLVAERARLGLPPLTSSGGYNKRLQRGSTTKWSNHSWGLAVDFNAAANPYRRGAPTDMPPGTSAKARSLGMTWGGDYKGKRDPMHFEVVVSPAEAARIARALAEPADRDQPPPASTTPPPASTTAQEDDLMLRLLKRADDGVQYLIGPGVWRRVGTVEEGREEIDVLRGKGLLTTPTVLVNAREFDLIKQSLETA